MEIVPLLQWSYIVGNKKKTYHLQTNERNFLLTVLDPR